MSNLLKARSSSLSNDTSGSGPGNVIDGLVIHPFLTALESNPWLDIDLVNDSSKVAWMLVSLCPASIDSYVQSIPSSFLNIEIRIGNQSSELGNSSTNSLCANYEGPAKMGEQVALRCDNNPLIGRYVIFKHQQSYLDQEPNVLHFIEVCEVIIYVL